MDNTQFTCLTKQIPPPPVNYQGQLYTVQAGDTLYKIANRHGVTLQRLRKPEKGTLTGDLPARKNKILIDGWYFNELCLDDSQLYNEYVKNTQYSTDVFSWNFAFVWTDGQSSNRQILWKIVDDMLVTFALRNKSVLYLWALPFGKGDVNKVVEVLNKCIRFCLNHNNGSITNTLVRTVNEPQLNFLQTSESFNQNYSHMVLNGREIIYKLENMIELHGKKMKNARHKINKFRREYPNAIIRSYNDDDYNGLMELQQYWTETSGKKYREVFDMQSYKKLIENHDKLGHFILVAEIDDELVGMITGGETQQGEAWSYFLKAKKDLSGLSEMLIVELAHKFRQLNPNFQFSNVGSDMGPRGLREFKRKFDPSYSWRRYRIRPNRNFARVNDERCEEILPN